MNLFNPGTDNQSAGDYIETDESGNVIEPERIITIEAGDRLPPTRDPNNKWKMI